MRAAHIKILSAIASGGAVLAMGGLAITADDGTAPMPMAAPILPGPMTQGGTVTSTAIVTVLATEKAVVTHKAQPYKG
jgi:hypothetical protein